MSFQKLIQFKALSQVYGSTGSALIDQIGKDPVEAAKLKLRNVCALISNPLFDELENVCSVLSLSKREFIEAALIECLNQAQKIIDEEGVIEHFEAVTQGFEAQKVGA